MKRATRLLYLLAVLPALALPADAQVQVSEEHTSKATDSSPAGHEWTQHRFTLNNGLLRYILGYQAHWATDGLAVHLSPEGYLGMPGPTSANWYAGGFMNILLNGKSLGKERPAGLRLVERGERGMVEMLWDAPDAQLRVRFMLEPGCDYLACELAVQPKTDLQRLELALNCFPSYFTSWNKRDGWRQIVGPATTVEQGAEATPDPAQDYWLLYQDTVFDVATEKDSGGPCGLLVVPEQVATMKVRPTSYPVSTHLAAAPGVLRWRMAFWDFHSKTNAPALHLLNGVVSNVYVNGSVARFTGPDRVPSNSSNPDNAPPALASFAQMTVAANNGVRITGDLKYEDPPCSGVPVRNSDGSLGSCDW